MTDLSKQEVLAPKKELPNRESLVSNGVETPETDQNLGTEGQDVRSTATKTQVPTSDDDQCSTNDSVVITTATSQGSKTASPLHDEAPSPVDGYETVDMNDLEIDKQNGSDLDGRIHGMKPEERPIYIRTKREHISPTTANTFRVPWVFDPVSIFPSFFPSFLPPSPHPPPQKRKNTIN